MSDFEIKDGVLVRYSGQPRDLAIPDGVTAIGERAFYDTFNDFYNEYTVTIPSGVKRIEKEAFHFCNVSEVLIPESCEEIGEGAFNYCGIRSIVVPAGVRSIEDETFVDCNHLGSIILPGSVRRIGNRAFANADLISVELPEGLEEIDDGAFAGCGKLERVTFPSTLRRIGVKAFAPKYDFSDTYAFDELILPEGLEEIDEMAFSGHKELKKLTLPASLKKVGSRAFAGCKNLDSVTILGWIEQFGIDVFDGCGAVEFSSPDPTFLNVMAQKEFIIEDGSVLKKYKGHKKEATVPEGIKTIAPGAFTNNEQIEKIVLPDGLEKIEGGYMDGAFAGCRGLRSIVIPDSVQEIGWNSFYGCSNLTEMTLPLRAIGDDMFGASGKTIILNVKDDDGRVHRNYASFRKEYFVQSFKYPKDHLFPLNEEDYHCFDRVLAAGSFDGFNINENGRVRACLWRLENREFPIEKELLDGMLEFLKAKASKAIKTAEEDRAPQYITSMVNYGVIDDGNRKRLTNAIKKSEVPEIAAMADHLVPDEDFVPNAPGQTAAAGTAAEPAAEDELDVKLRKARATELMLKSGIDSIPDVMLADGSGTADGRIVRYIIAVYLKDGSCFSEDADREAEKLDRDSLVKALRTIYSSFKNEKKSTAFLPVLFRYADGKTMTELYPSLAKNKWKAEQVNDALLLNDTREAMLYADKAGMLDEYAELRGQSADVLRDTVLSEFDLDENGQKTYDLGNGTVTATLMDDLKVGLYDNSAGKTVKSIPKRGADEDKYQAASKDFSDLKKNIKKVVKNRADILFESFLFAREFDAEDWKKVYLGNPVLNRIARLIVWQQDGQTFTVSGKDCIKVTGETYEPNGSYIIIAHPMEMKEDEVIGWQEYFRDNGLKQPFIQMWEPVYDKETVKEDRYKDIMIPYYRFLNQDKHGIWVSDNDYHNEIVITLLECQTDIERIDFRRHDIAVDDRFEITSFRFNTFSRQVNHLVAYFDRVTAIERVKQDDVSVMKTADRFNVEQIMALIEAAQQNEAVNVLAALLEYRDSTYPGYSTVDSLTLDL